MRSNNVRKRDLKFPIKCLFQLQINGHNQHKILVCHNVAKTSRSMMIFISFQLLRVVFNIVKTTIERLGKKCYWFDHRWIMDFLDKKNNNCDLCNGQQIQKFHVVVCAMFLKWTGHSNTIYRSSVTEPCGYKFNHKSTYILQIYKKW